MRYLHGREFIADTLAPRSGWLDAYIHPDDQPYVQKRSTVPSKPRACSSSSTV
jgi:hypothetical protein